MLHSFIHSNCFFTFLRPPPFTDAIHRPWQIVIFNMCRRKLIHFLTISTSHSVIAGNSTQPKWFHHFCLSFNKELSNDKMTAKLQHLCMCLIFSATILLLSDIQSTGKWCITASQGTRMQFQKASQSNCKIRRSWQKHVYNIQIF